MCIRDSRNTLRFLLANLMDFNSQTDLFAVNDCLEIDRYMLAFTESFQEDLTQSYQRYEFHQVVHKLHCLLYTSPSPRDRTRSRMPSSA